MEIAFQMKVWKTNGFGVGHGRTSGAGDILCRERGHDKMLSTTLLWGEGRGGGGQSMGIIVFYCA